MSDLPEERHLSRKEKQEERILQKILAAIEPRLTELSPPLPTEDLGQVVRFMESMKALTASALLAAAIGAAYEYLTLAGVVDMSPARMVLIMAAFFGSMFVWEVASSFFKTTPRQRGGVTLIGAIVIVLCAVALDHWVSQWRLKHPPDIEALSNKITGVQASIDRLTSSKTDTQKVTNDQLRIKEIMPVPGFLKREFSYPRKPLDQIGHKALMDALFLNKGSTYVHDAYMKGAMFYVDFHGVRPPLSDVAMQKQLEEQVSKLDNPASLDIGPGDSLYNSYETGVITKSMLDAMDQDTARIYFVSHAEWTTNGTRDHVDTCQWLQPSSWRGREGIPPEDSAKMDPVWHGC